ncbi:hypothetical protein VMCG_10475 [Cytospora schulzeri]|uniref:Uncharacterized protein n=1 Tax=Cytospora schulzeri TaxID=448051 RepID=A0A423VBR4_9PEZI|nr:hypothetical protein VMCG_10475 [Valsa malicola]
MIQRRNDPIAIVGSACRFAGGIGSPSQLWEVLQSPRDLSRVIPSSRFNPAGFYHADGSHHGRTNVKHAYTLEGDPGAFDAEFFGVKPVEAQAIDPQQRFLMEVAYEALESAGLTMDSLKGSDTGVFVGAMSYDYGAMILRDLSDLPVYTATGTGASILSNRLSYFFDWHGPSITLDTACSSSLVAVHLAIQALRAGDSRTALACGSNMILGPENFIIESKLKMLSPNGRSRMWDDKADGYARGEGIGVLVLKTLHDALEDGDFIECVIRETALNQDGASNYAGITMPHAYAQEALIRATYTKAGLDLTRPGDGPQFFEAHGTGTPVGDPAEAEAIYNAISQHRRRNSGHGPLYVGSIKTVLGHTEGTAGIAAIMKASLALRHGLVPPNLLFDQLSSRVAPFYEAVEVPTVAKPWPQQADCGETRRASVNSFGFGGTNAHAILENYSSVSTLGSGGSTIFGFTPYVFSAFSERSLREILAAYAGFLGDRGSKIDARDLCWTLHKRRSTLPHRIAFPASSVQDLSANIALKLGENSAGVKALSVRKTGKVLGIFTGQGAQYARMGAELVENSGKARDIIDSLEASLNKLPDGPDWSLKDELLAEESSSRVHEAAISQPLCTAIQILLVDLLRLSGIEFDAVVGHSSGEIAAAYAAGYLSAEHCMKVSYYRGLHLRHASGPNGHTIKGAMLAVSSSAEDLEDLCRDPVFSGRVSIAASNSPSSFTLSGDEDAIDELQILLNDENKFNRRLRVDTAYHSDHMLPCYQPYVESLVRSGIQPQRSSSTCTWVSSVNGHCVGSSMDLTVNYWAENLTCPVLFSLALENALKVANESYDLVFEVGAHPALKAPSTQTIELVAQRDIPYTALLSRGLSAVTASSAGLGFAWTHLESGRVDLDRYEQELSGNKDRPRVIKDLPTYCWNHEGKYWHESRSSRKLRSREYPANPLLGDTTPDSAAHHMIWKNVLRVSELEWIAGHRVQGQIVFPAAGYLATALEAARFAANAMSEEIRLIEISNFVVHRAMVFDREDVGIEVLTQLCEITRHEKTKSIHTKITYSAALPSSTDELTVVASGQLDILLGPASSALLPIRSPTLPHMVNVDTDRFYQALAQLGYEFSGRFRSLSELKRRHFQSSCLVQLQPSDDLLIHPAELDAVLQSCMLAYSYPFDEQLRTLHLPRTIQRIRVSPAVLLARHSNRSNTAAFVVDAAVRRIETNSKGLSGDITMYPSTASHGAVQIQSATFVPVEVSGGHDRKVFSKEYWANMTVDGSIISQAIPLAEEHRTMHLLLERIATFYLRKFDRDVAPDDPIRSQSPISHYLDFACHITSTIQAGKHGSAQPEWLHDTLEDIIEASRSFSSVVDFEIMHLVGKQMPRVFRGETTMLEEFRAGGSVGILDRYYAEGFGLSESARWIGLAVAHIVDRYPHMNILEIGAGTGSATKAIFREIGQRSRSYTYTDVSAAFFENASQSFRQQQDRIVFKTLDIEQDPLQQGYHEGAYDLVVAFFVIHATSDIERALRNIRRLLRPGGFLVVGEGQEGPNAVASSGFIFGTLPGWWLGAGKDGRNLSPHISPEEWARLLRATGFSGIDVSVPASWQGLLNVYHFVAQAVDDQVQFFREPLAPSRWRPPPIEKLVIVGGQTNQSSRLVEGLRSALADEFATEVHTVKALSDLDYDRVVDINTTVLSLTELDGPIFKDITPASFEAIKNMFGSGKRLFWVTSRRLDVNPLSNMTVGFGRVAANESPDLRLQQLDVEEPLNIEPRIVVDIFLRFYASEFKDDSLLWSLEPETRVDSRGYQLFSRLRPVTELNDRYNSIDRAITHEKSIRESPIILQHCPRGFVIKDFSTWEASVSETHIDSADMLKLCITHATISAIRTPIGYRFLALGLRPEDGASVLALTPSLASVLTISARSTVPVEVVQGSEHKILATVAAHLVASAVLDPLCRSQTILVHNGVERLALAFTTQAAEKDIKVVFTSDSTQGDYAVASSIWLPEFATQQDIDDVLPSDPVAFVDFGVGETAWAKNEPGIASSLPAHCRIENTKTLFSTTGGQTQSSLSPVLGETLRRALRLMQESIRLGDVTSSTGHPSINLRQVADGPVPADPLTIVDFTRETLVPVRASRLDLRPMFKGSGSTYWVAGMTGLLGISLCDWMINNGAKNVVISSRRPEVSPDWIEACKRKGANVMAITCNMTKESEVIAVHKSICESWPPIVGVINGAMVLRDISIRNMQFEQLVEVLAPKVYGSMFLDRIFHDTDLDFFVLVSSINCIIGSWGQANYAAANTFMCGLAAQRRERGYRAATVNVGAIIGAGYMERESRRALDSIVQKLHMMRLSEEDWHQAISEAIDASRLASDHGPELTTGLSEVPFDVVNTPNWFTNPRYSEFITYPKAHSGDTGDTRAPVSLQAILQGCSTRQDLRTVVRKAFADQLRIILQVTRSDDDLLACRSSDIGVDSLVSVDIRSWFFKNLQVSTPVLMIMGNSSMGSLVEYAVENMPTEMSPGLDAPGDSQQAEAMTSTSASSVPSDMPVCGPSSVTPLIPFSQDPATVQREHTGAEAIDWEAESSPPRNWASVQMTTASPVSNPPETIVLTGVTGLLGRHLLEHLLKHTSAKTVHCLAVRGLTARLQNHELPIDTRIRYYSGDLSDPLLGLSSQEARSIFSSADAVIHNGADTSHIKPYSAMRAPNVGSTLALANLCLPRLIPIHYISSAGVGIYFNQDIFPEVSLASSPESSYPPSNGAFGYGCSKWVCERVLERTHAQFGLPVFIYRPSTIIREGTDASTARARLDWVNSLLYHVRKLGVAPRIENNTGALDLVRVESCCAAILEHLVPVQDHDVTVIGQVVFANLVGDVVIPMQYMGDADLEAGRRYELLPLSQWTERAMEAGLNPSVAMLIEEMDAPGGPKYPRLLKGNQDNSRPL